MTSRARALGYTAVEVLVALTLFAIGAAGVISMQRGAVLGNVDARRLDAANAIARTWTERLRRDAALWTLPNASNPEKNNRAKALLIANVALPADGAWTRPVARYASEGMSPGFDILGGDVDPASAYFCAQVKLTWLVVEQMIRAEVRVFWPRGLDVGADTNYCGRDLDVTNLTDRYHFVYAVTSLRRNPAP